MTTSSLYHGFALGEQALNREVGARVREAAAVEELYLLGLTTTHRRTESLFCASQPSRRALGRYWLLAVVPPPNGPSLSGLPDQLESCLRSLLPVTMIVVTTTQFSQWLAEVHPFAAAVYEKGFLLYKKEGAETRLLPPVDIEAWTARMAILQRETAARIEEFLAGVDLYTLRQQYRLAAFLLHQAAEQALRTALLVNTGLRLNTHNLRRLIRCCGLFCYRLPQAFDLRRQEDARLLRLLQKAYVEARYSEDFAVRGEDIRQLLPKVKTLVTLLTTNPKTAKFSGKDTPPLPSG